ncbi:MAG: reverse transcriptase domain-containing protein [Candidatus Nanopelagicales bacterium]
MTGMTKLRVDTQSQATIFNDPRFFPHGVDATDTLAISTITAQSAGRTDGKGLARVITANGDIIEFTDAHLCKGAKECVLSTEAIEKNAILDMANRGLRLLDGNMLIPFDAGYCSIGVRPDADNIYGTTTDGRHPDARTAILATGIHFGGVTSNPQNPTAGTREMTTEEIGKLYANRTALSGGSLRMLAATADVHTKLSNVPSTPRNDHDTMRANFPKLKATAHGSMRDDIACFDLQGPFTASKHSGYRYLVNFVVLRMTKDGEQAVEWNIDFLHTKDEFPDALERFLNEGDRGQLRMYTDNEIVLNSRKVKTILTDRKMKQLHNSCEYEPWQNPAERPWRTISAAVREFLMRGFGDDSDEDPNAYWTYAVQQFAHVHAALHPPDGKTGRASHLRTPFCLGYVRTPAYYMRSKHAPQAEAAVHLGYSRTKPGYVMQIIEGPRAGRVVTASQVKFREHIFPMHKGYTPRAVTTELPLWADIDWEQLGDDDIDDGNPDDAYEIDDDAASIISGPVDPDDLDLPDVHVFLTPTSSEWAPKHFTQIGKIDDKELRNAWFRAHFDEIDGLLATPDVMKFVPLPPGISEDDLLKLITLYTVKKDGRKKARTVLGCGKGALDPDSYGAVFSPTARDVTLRTLCALCPQMDLVIHGCDVKQAYGKAKWPAHLKKALARVPMGYDKYYDGQTYCVEIGNLYGHPIAGRNWWHRLRDWHLTHGFTQSEFDPCCFYKKGPDGIIFILTYVDDILAFSTRGGNLRDAWAAEFFAEFDVTDFGTDLHDFISIHIDQNEGFTTLDQTKFIDAIVNEYFPAGIHQNYVTPAVKELVADVFKATMAKDTTHSGTEIGKKFRRLIMQMLYIATKTRPDIALPIALLTRVQGYPNPTLLKHAERVLIYLAGTREKKLTYHKTVKSELNMSWAPRVTVKGSADSTFEMAHSTSGYVFFLSGAAVAWSVKKQKSIALSSYEAEVMAGSLAACEAVFLRGIMSETGNTQLEPTVIQMDSSSAIDLANDPVMHDASKHIARRDLFLRELVERKVVSATYVKTADNVADALTKPLDKSLFFKHRTLLLGENDILH